MAIVVASLKATTALAQTAPNLNASNLLLPFIDLLNNSSFQTDNLQGAVSINNGSTTVQRNQAVIDNAFSTDNGSLIADGLGTALNKVYQNAIDNNSPLLAPNSNIVQTFSQANAIATSDAGYDKSFFMNATVATTGSTTADLRPFQTVPNQIDNFAPGLLVPVTNNPAFPSGNATFGYMQALMFAIMVPEQYTQLLTRASEYGNSRIVLGAHSPIDIIGGRILAEYDLVQLLSGNPAYANQTVSTINGGTVTTSSDFPTLFSNATSDLRGLLHQGCGTTIATCATSGASDRFGSSQQNRDDYTYRLTYGLPSVGPTDLPPVVPADAELLIKSRFPYLTIAQLRDVLATTELPSGVPLDDGSGWARLDLYAAANGYGAFNSDVSVTMDASLGGYNAADSWNNNIGGTGGLTLNGTGTLTLTGTDTYSGPTVINGGTLSVTGDISPSSSVTVNAGGTLGGTGTVPSTLVNGGTLMPGLSGTIGTLTVKGSLVFTSAAAYLVTIKGTSASVTSVTGTATLGDASVQIASGSQIAVRQPYTLLTASGGLIGSFNSAIVGAPGAALTYDANDVYLCLGCNSFQQSLPTSATANQRAVAAALDVGASGGALVKAALGLSAANLPQAFDALSGEVHATANTAIFNDSRYVRQAVLGRLGQASYAGASGATATLGSSGAIVAYSESDLADIGTGLPYAKRTDSSFPVKAVPAHAPDSTYWAQAFGGWGTIGSDGNAAGAHDNLVGFFSGVDRRFGQWRAGIAGGYTDSNLSVSARASSAAIDTAYLTAYAGTTYDAWNVRSGAAFAWHTINTTRSVVFPGFAEQDVASYSTAESQMFGEIGYGMAFGTLAAEPFAGLSWVHLYTGGFNEIGGASALIGSSNNDDVGYSTLGARAAIPFLMSNGMTLTLRASAAWQRAYGPIAPAVPLNFASAAASFSISGAPLARDSALVEAGADLIVSANAKVSISYVGQLAGSTQSNSIVGSFTWRL